MKMMKHTVTTAAVLFFILLTASPSASARKAKGAMESLEEVSKVMKKTAWKKNFYLRRSVAKADMERRNHIFRQLEPDFTVCDTLIYIESTDKLFDPAWGIYWIYASSPNRIMKFHRKSQPDIILEWSGSYADEENRAVRFIIDMAMDKKFDIISESAESPFTGSFQKYYYTVIIRENDGFRLIRYERLGQTFRQLREREAIIIVPDIIPAEDNDTDDDNDKNTEK